MYLYWALADIFDNSELHQCVSNPYMETTLPVPKSLTSEHPSDRIVVLSYKQLQDNQQLFLFLTLQHAKTNAESHKSSGGDSKKHLKNGQLME